MVIQQHFKDLIGRTVNNLFIAIWSPFAESRMIDVSMAVAMQFDDHQQDAIEVKIDKDGWTPIVTSNKIRNLFRWGEFDSRVKAWMNEELDDLIGYEFYDGRDAPFFIDIISEQILDVELITLESEFNPFAVKLIFRNDWIIVSPTADGSTVETKLFNQHNNILVFEHLGEIIHMNSQTFS